MAGIQHYETVQIVDGKSFVGLLRNPEKVDADKTLVWHFPNLWGETQEIAEGYGAYSSILKGDYHLIYHWENGLTELYNVKNDISEQNNLAGDMPDKVRELSSELTDYLKARNAQRPSLKATHEMLSYPDGSK